MSWQVCLPGGIHTELRRAGGVFWNDHLEAGVNAITREPEQVVEVRGDVLAGSAE